MGLIDRLTEDSAEEVQGEVLRYRVGPVRRGLLMQRDFVSLALLVDIAENAEGVDPAELDEDQQRRFLIEAAKRTKPAQIAQTAQMQEAAVIEGVEAIWEPEPDEGEPRWVPVSLVADKGLERAEKRKFWVGRIPADDQAKIFDAVMRLTKEGAASLRSFRGGPETAGND